MLTNVVASKWMWRRFHLSRATSQLGEAQQDRQDGQDVENFTKSSWDFWRAPEIILSPMAGCEISLSPLHQQLTKSNDWNFFPKSSWWFLEGSRNQMAVLNFWRASETKWLCWISGGLQKLDGCVNFWRAPETKWLCWISGGLQKLDGCAKLLEGSRNCYGCKISLCPMAVKLQVH